MKRIFSAVLILLFNLNLLASSAFSQRNQLKLSSTSEPIVQATEEGRFRLFIWKMPVGEERYTIERNNESLIVRSSFEYSYTNKKASLTALLQTRRGLQPERYEIKGTTLQGAKLDTSVSIAGRSATVREGAETRQVAIPGNFFTIRTPFPVAIEMMLVRYWTSRQIRQQLKTFPDNQVMIDYHGHDTINVGKERAQFDCYSVGGLTWGRTWLWFDSAKRLIAAITPNMDTSSQLQAIREGYESALPDFLTKAGERGMSQLWQVASRIKNKHKELVAIIGGTLVDGTGKPATNDSAVIIQGGRIVAVGPRSQTKIPKGATIIDARGKTVLPGLWDMHAHMRQVEWGPVYLAAGVTTARDVGNDLEFVTAMRDAIRSGRGLGPRMLLAGFIDADDPTTVTGYHANTPEEARALVNIYKRAGFDQVKVWNNVKADILKVIIAEAHRLGMTVTGHVPKAVNAFQAVEAGQDQINHVAFIIQSLPNGNIDSDETKKALQVFKERGTVIETTLAVVELLTHPIDTPISTFEPGVLKAPTDLTAVLNRLGVPQEQATGARSFFSLALNVVGYLHKIGVPMVAGTDQVVPGHSLHRELELYVKAGFTPMEAIQAATIVPARAMRMDQEVGTIERGKRADLIITDGNPLDNISNIRNVKSVVTNGEIYDSAQLWEAVGFRP
ncbi:MAG TPA: amidohydrolase family protein [Pyrinomonadaceae bacterium]|jgi:imidazolonepropionase-like amidohydrolase